MKRLAGILFVLVLISSMFPKGYAYGAEEIKVVISARCLFGGIVLAQDEFKRSSGIQLKINKACAGLGKGVEAVINGRADMGTLARELSDREKRAGIVATLVSTDGLAIYVNKKNSVENLSLHNVRDIFLGKITNWKEVGGDNKNIIIIRSLCGVSAIDVIDDILLKGEKPLQGTKVIEVEIGDLVTERLDVYSTGIAALSPLFKSDEVKSLKINGILPERSNVKDGRYPLVRPVYIVTRGEPTGNLKKFVDFMLSKKGQEIVERGLAMDWLNEGF